MKYNLRFGMKTVDGWKCFATVASKHLPKNGQLVYLGDEVIKDTWNLGIELATVYKVVQRVFCYNNYSEADDCSAVEITVVTTNISQ